jgi:hypothetical protein
MPNLPPWLADAIPTAEELSLQVLALRLAISMVLGLVIAAVYFGSQRRLAGETAALTTTIVLLTVLVAMTTLVIGDSVARAFGLVGALSIVRFRTVVDDTRDTAFVIFAVVVGMAVGAGYLAVALVGIPIVSLIAFGMGALNPLLGGRRTTQKLEVRLANGHDPDLLLGGAFERHLRQFRLTAATTAKQGTSLDLHYAVQLRNKNGACLALVRELQHTEGVQGVELHDL